MRRPEQRAAVAFTCTCMAAMVVVALAVAVWGLALDGLGRYHLHKSAV